MAKLQKFHYAFGVSAVLFLQYFLLMWPNMVPLAFLIVTAVSFGIRYSMYYEKKCNLYLWDFCYFVCISVIINIFVFPTDIERFKMNYILSMGPLPLAVGLWKNSLVFHSLDKLLSTGIHLGPACVVHLIRWGYFEYELNISQDEKLNWCDYGTALAFYLRWQVFVYLLHHIVYKKELEDPNVMTTSRYVLKQIQEKKEYDFWKRWIKKAWVSLKICGSAEEIKLDPKLKASSFTVMAFQLCYTAVTFLVVPLMWNSISLSIIYLLFNLFQSIYYAATYYFDYLNYTCGRCGIVNKVELIEEEQEDAPLDSDDENLDFVYGTRFKSKHINLCMKAEKRHKSPLEEEHKECFERLLPEGIFSDCHLIKW